MEMMAEVLPGYVMEKYKLLGEKVSMHVLERGVLLPHPKEDYELLEERVLEALELESGVGRVLKCGHFQAGESDEEEDGDDEADEEDGESDGEDEGRCEDCGRHVRDGRFGDVGCGRRRRWNVKIYAANGLMRQGAWMAAWREMERVDVEIEPWIAEGLRRELDGRVTEKRKLEEEEEMRKRWEAEEEDERQREMEETPRVVVDELDGEGVVEEERKRRLREVYGEDAVPFAAPAAEEKKEEVDVQVEMRPKVEIPLRLLLRNYLVLLASDKRNLAIFVLSMLVAAMAVRSSPASRVEMPMGLEAVDLQPVASVLSSATAAATDMVSHVVGKEGLETHQGEKCRYPSDDGCAAAREGDVFGADTTSPTAARLSG